MIPEFKSTSSGKKHFFGIFGTGNWADSAATNSCLYKTCDGEEATSAGYPAENWSKQLPPHPKHETNSVFFYDPSPIEKPLKHKTLQTAVFTIYRRFFEPLPGNM